MFCEQCGTKNDGNAKFCESCGHKLASQTPPDTGGQPVQQQVPVQPQPRMTYEVRAIKIPKSAIVFVIEVFVLIILIAAFLATGKKLAAPAATADKFVKNLKEQDWERVYDDMDIPGHELLTREHFVRVMKKKMEEEGGILKYTVYDEEYLSSDFVRYITVTYTRQGDSQENTMNINLLKQDERIFLFYPQWKITSNTYIDIAQECEIYAPVGSTVYLEDDVVLDKYLEEESYYGYDVYKINMIFAGAYNVRVESDVYETWEGDVDFKTDGMEYVGSESLRTDIQNELKDIGKNAVQELYTLGAANDELDKENSILGTVSDIDYIFGDIINSIHNNSSTRLQTISFSDYVIDTDRISVTYEDGNTAVNMYIDFNYSGTKKEKNWDGEYEEEKFGDSGSVNCYFVYVDGEWELRELDLSGIYW